MRSCFFIMLVSCFLSCKNKQEVLPSPPGYNLQAPHVINLPSDLDEISGLTYYAKDKGIFAISDEKGQLFKITVDRQTTIKKWKFSSKADFEDVVLVDSTFYILKSDGDMAVVKFGGNDSIHLTEAVFPFKGKNEFEAMFYNPLIKKLVILCKDCDGDSKRSMSSFWFDPENNVYTDSVVKMDLSSLSKEMDVKKFHFKSSAAAINPITGELYVLSSINKLLMVLDKNNAIKAFYKLNRGLFKQPKGMTFSDNGTLIISNESAEVGTANLLIFNYTK